VPAAEDRAEDPLLRLADLPGVFEALEAARGAVDALLRDLRGPALRRRTALVSADALRRSAWAGAALELGGRAPGEPADFAPPFPADHAGRTAAGAWRVATELPALAPTWQRAPGQALARLHALAAADLVEPAALGRPDPAVAGGAQRLAALADLLTGPTRAPALVVAAVAHGEILTLQPFGVMDGVVARAAARLVTTGRALDPSGAAVVEEGHLELGLAAYAAAAEAYGTGTEEGVAHWVGHCAQAVALGARVGRGIAAQVAEPDERRSGP
jgi:hypothetical protein